MSGAGQDLDVFLYYSLLYYLVTRSLIEPEAHVSSRLAGYPAPGIRLFLNPQCLDYSHAQTCLAF